MSALVAMLGAATGANIKQYVDDVFSAYTYIGTGAARSINTGIDLAGKGGLVWTKNRSTANHVLQDTVRGALQELMTNLTSASSSVAGSVTSFNSNGHSLGTSANYNTSGGSFASWTFRRAPKFFDVVTYTGDGTSFQTISHSLGVKPGMIIVKNLTNTNNWIAVHKDSPYELYLNASTNPGLTPYVGLGDTSTFNVADYSSGAAGPNGAGNNYVAYLFAHDTSADGLIQCGTYTGDGNAAGPTVTLGWELQFLMVKAASTSSDWFMMDASRGINVVGSPDLTLSANTTTAEVSLERIEPTATGFKVATSSIASINASGVTYVYVAIRRSNKPPTLGTQVYNAIARSGNGSLTHVTGAGFDPDLLICQTRQGVTADFYDRLRGPLKRLYTTATAAELSPTDTVTSFDMDGYSTASSSTSGVNNASYTYINWLFGRAPGVFDIVCWTGDGNAAKQTAHTLGVTPELVIHKARSTTGAWVVAALPLEASSTPNMLINSTGAASTAYGASCKYSTPTTFYTDVNTGNLNVSGTTYVSYLFASLSGISKVGSYTGNGGSQVIDCGFSNGARFVLVKRSDAVGDWYIWDSVRGIVAANDPHLSLNLAVAEVTTDDSVDPDPSGFAINQNTATNINVNLAKYIFLAIA